MTRHRTVVVLIDQVLPLDFAIPMHVFAREAAEIYEVSTASIDGKPVGVAGGLSVVPDGDAGCCGTPRPSASPAGPPPAPGLTR